MKTKRYFSRNSISKRQLRTLICNFAWDMGVKKVSFNKRAIDIAGSYNYEKRVIFLSNKQNRREILLTFFHELAHHIASTKKHKWLAYHMNAATPLLTPAAKFTIENKIDKLAKKLWFKHVNTKAWGRYKYGYPQSNKKNITEWIRMMF
jgi:hypothetical protein